MMPTHIPSDSSQKKILKAFKKIGWELLDERWGKGYHRVVREPNTQFELVVQKNIYKEVLKTFCKELEARGYDASEFVRYL